MNACSKCELCVSLAEEAGWRRADGGMEEACELAKPTWEMEGPAEAREAAGEGGRGVSEPRVETALWPRWPEAGEVGLEEEKGTLPRALSC